MSSYEYTDPFGQRLRIAPVQPEHPDEAPALWFETTDGGFRGASVKVPVAMLEEAIAGQRDMARQAGGRPEPGPCMCGHRKDEHVTVSGRLLCDSCDPDDTTAPTCSGYDELVVRIDVDTTALKDAIRKAVQAGPLPGTPMTDEQRARAYYPPGSLLTAASLRSVMPRRFALLRHHDVSGVSGTGLVADGVLWPDGTASVRWHGEHPSTVFWDRGQLSVEHIHGHQGATEIVWIDEAGA